MRSVQRRIKIRWWGRALSADRQALAIGFQSLGLRIGKCIMGKSRIQNPNSKANSYFRDDFQMKKTLLLGLLLTFLLTGCSSPKERSFPRTRLLMGTKVTITVRDVPEGKAYKAINHAFQEMERIESLFSTYKEDSEISRINREAGEKVIPANPEVIMLIGKSLHFSSLSGGAFDITVRPLMQLWGFTRKEGRIPSREELERTLPLVNYKNILLDGKENRIGFSREGVEIDLGGIAKGYAVDKAVEVLRKEGINSALVNAGGDLFALGSFKKRPWRVGIRDPRQREEIMGILEVEDRGVATSGNYERYFIHKGKRYSHLINPWSGLPVEGIEGVTIIAPNTTTADALATAVFVLGPQKGIKLIDELKGVEGLIVDSRGETFSSRGFNKYLRDW